MVDVHNDADSNMNVNESEVGRINLSVTYPKPYHMYLYAQLNVFARRAICPFYSQWL